MPISVCAAMGAMDCNSRCWMAPSHMNPDCQARFMRAGAVRRRADAPARRGDRFGRARHAWPGPALGRLLAFGGEFFGHREHLAARYCARLGWRALDPGILRARSPKHDQLADRLDERGAELGGLAALARPDEARLDADADADAERVKQRSGMRVPVSKHAGNFSQFRNKVT